MVPQSGVARRQSDALGRSGPRSKSGCQTCRTRRVRCDEKRPVCSHCERLKLECAYQPPQQRRRRQRPRIGDGDTPDGRPAGATGRAEAVQQDENTAVSDALEGAYEDAGNGDLDGDGDSMALSLDQPHGGAGREAHSDSHRADNQFMLDDVSCVPSDGTTLNGASSRAADLSQSCHTSSNLWPPVALNDYMPLPDPTFPFTSLGFTSSMNLFDSEAAMVIPTVDSAEGAQAWRSDISDVPVPSCDASNGPRAVHGNCGNGPATTAGQGLSRRSASRQAFAVSPPLLTPTQEEALLVFFERDIRPPASLVGVDPLGWLKIKRYVLRMARDGNEVVKHALFAVSTLLSAASLPIRLGTNRIDHRLFASRLQEAACAAIEVGLSHDDWETRSSHALLVSVFLLAWFEAAFDENEDRPAFPKSLAEQVIVQGKGWNPGSAHLFQWLTLLDAKVSHLGGRHLLSEQALQVVRQSRPSLTQTDLENDGDGDEADQLAGSVELGSSTSKVTTPPSKSAPPGRLAYLLSSGTPSSLPSKVIRMDIFNILLQPAFEFHMTSQAYSRRIGCHDRHHRNRGTPEDELEVMNACMGYEGELQELWRRRPGILNLDASKLKQFVSEDIARRLEQLFSVYIATFWTHFIYIQRVAFWSLKHTPVALKAIDQTGDMMRRSVGQPVHQHAFDVGLARTPRNSIHPGLMWACFMLGCEVAEPVQQEWCVLQLRALGKLRATGADGPGAEAADELLAFRLDEKGAQNALKASRLLEQLIERQTRAGERVDGKYLSQELFGCHFYII